MKLPAIFLLFLSVLLPPSGSLAADDLICIPSSQREKLMEAGIPVIARSASRFYAEIGDGEKTVLQEAEIPFETLFSGSAGREFWFVALKGGADDMEKISKRARVLSSDGDELLVTGEEAEVERLAEEGFPLRRIFRRPLPLERLAEGPSRQKRAIAYDDRVQDVLDRVEEGIYTDYLRALTGYDTAVIGGVTRRIETRYSYSMFNYGQTNALAMPYLRERLEALGWDVEVHGYPRGSTTWYNVIATKDGEVDPDRIHILCAHYDSIAYGSSTTDAPGADDNASGSVAALEAARLFRRHAFDETVKICLWSGEEQGLYGSAAWVAAADAAGLDIRSAINLDMIAWDSDGNDYMDVHDGTQAPSQDLGGDFVDAISVYGLGIVADVKGSSSTNRSDHASFWNYGYPSFLAIEDFSDFNPYYHSANDAYPGAVDFPIAMEIVKASLATIAHRASIRHRDPDLTMNDRVDSRDLGVMMSAWGSASLPPSDLNEDGVVDTDDLTLLLAYWGS